MTVTEAINIILRAVPDRWPIPLPASAVIVVALTLSINSWVIFDKAKDFATSSAFLNLEPNQCRSETFDYVIVGAGAAGMIVATRIANASRDSSILLLEAGGEPSILNDLPSMDFFLLNQPANTWIYNSTPQRYSCGHCDDRRSLTTRGKMLGGSTSNNFMMYVRGNRNDYDRWGIEDAGGDPQWSYKALLPYFKKSEDYNGAHQYSPDAHIFHGKGGLLNVATFDYMPGTKEFLDAAREKGYRVGDYNGEEQEVFSPIDVTTQDGWRESTYRAFYRDTGKPPNLCIKKYSEVIRINFDKSFGNNPRAVGVSYTKHKRLYQAWARKEVILCAGVIGTPKLLLLSGVGPAYDLQSFGIPVVRDLPVGENLQDHAYTIVGPFLRSPSLNPNRDVTPQAAAKFLIDGSGAIAAPAGLAGIAFFQSPFAQPPYPDLEVVQFSVAMYPDLPRDLNRFFGIRESVLDTWFHPYHRLNSDARFLILWLGRPKSVGSVRLASTNPRDNPILDPQYLKHPDDIEALLYGFKKVVDLFENTTALNTPLFRKPVPNCQHISFKSDDYYRCVIRHFSGSLYHHVGSCALGKVVDNNLRVKGIDGLRIIDASVIPRSPNGNTQAPTFAVAEKGADLVINGDKGEWEKDVNDGPLINSPPRAVGIQVPDFKKIPIPDFKKIPNEWVEVDNFLRDVPPVVAASVSTPKVPVPPPQLAPIPVLNPVQANLYHLGYDLRKYNNSYYYEVPTEAEHSPSSKPTANFFNANVTTIHQAIQMKRLKLIRNFRNANVTTSRPKLETSFGQPRPQVQTTPVTKPPFLHIRLPQHSNSIYEKNREQFYDDSDDNTIFASRRNLEYSSLVKNLFLGMDN